MMTEEILFIAMNLILIKNKIKRFYQITNNNINFVRVLHGHKYEEKYLLVLQGVFKDMCCKN